MLGEYRDGEYYVEGLKYSFPQRPKLSEIKNYGLRKNAQVWSRITEYEEHDWEEGWEDRLNANPEQLQYLIDEVERIKNGFWIYIGGEPVYLNGACYFFLQWYLLPDSGEYPDYRDTSVYYYRFLEIVSVSKVATGDTLIKGRRLGATSMIIAWILRKMLLSERKNFGITSKTGDDAGEEGAFGFLVSAFESLPIFLKPEIEGGEVKRQVLSLRNKPRGKKIATSQGLLVKAFWRAPGMNTFDSGAYEEILIDESGKFDKKKTKVDIREYLPVVTKCIKKGAKVTGKLHLPTTVNPPLDGGDNYKQIWKDSDQSTADYLGKTISGLYRCMIPAYCGYAGYIGRFGESIWNTPTPEQTEYLISLGEGICPDPYIGAKQYLQNERDKLKNRPEDLQKEIQMNPFNAEEVFESANDRCIFDTNHLNQREKELEDKMLELGLDLEKGELGRRGWFKRDQNGRVHFIDNPEGLWYVYKLLRESEANLFEIKGNKQIPLNETLGAAGLDPIASGDATVDKGSDCCSIIRSRNNSLSPDEPPILAMFLGRMADVTKLNEQIFNGLIYYGVKILAERAPSNWLTYADNNDLLEYCYGTKRSDGSEVKGIVAQQTVSVKDEHAEVQVLSSLVDHDKIPSIRLIRDRKNFSVKDRTDYDACMADGYALMALRQPVKQVKKKVEMKRLLPKGRLL